MYASSEKKIDILNDHYKDTFSHLVSYRKQRDRLLIYLLVVTVILLLCPLFPKEINSAILKMASQKIEIKKIEPILVYLLLAISAFILLFRYFQLKALIEKQHYYLELLEAELASLYLNGIPFTRESNFSVKENRNLCIWSHKPYDLSFYLLFTFGAVLSLTLILRHFGFSFTGLVSFIGGIISAFYWNLKKTSKKDR